ncbi:penicillin-binding protein 2 [Ferrimonas sediminum]|uniref:Peptidoglycan D,D-transpeptidase MrdA n=1 Tax=Ferrimonas sediminum TaxID=718193 RepID=A0A1G8QL64_9GAMM|nr:penicillin-binding protein 2 [Ferrimonas sediminum]SDJ05353.1 penicillin-binding protein 2 [Ferrimonas sediminum]
MRFYQRTKIRDNAAETALFKRRAVACFVGVIALIAVLLSNLYVIQVVDHSEYQTRSNDNRIRVIPIAPNRGLIYDRHGTLLAENQPVYSLEVIAEQAPDLDQSLQELAQLYQIPETEQREFLKRVKGQKRFKPTTLLSQLSEEQVAEFSVNQHRYPGFQISAGLKRYYPYKQTLTHTLGYVARINHNDVTRLDQEGKSAMYAATKDIGKLGIERFYEEQLHGQPGLQEVEVNSRGRIVRTLDTTAPSAGKDLQLTLDLQLQQKAEQLMSGHRGALVAMDPRDGGVLAMVSNPSYDPNLFVHGISGKAYSGLLNDASRPLINRATQGQYAPASTVKPMLALAGLEEKKITEKSRIWDPGWWQIPGVERKYRNWKRWGHGWVDVVDALVKSNDTFFYDLAYNMGIDTISQYMLQFGFGQYSGIDLKEESAGIMPSRDWKRLRYKEPWYIGDTISVGIGQGYWTTTPLQLTEALTVMINRGQHLTPHLLRSMGNDGHMDAIPLSERPPLVLSNDKAWDIVHEAMIKTASKRFADASYTAAIKTGTAQVFGLAEDAKYEKDKIAEHLRDNALIVGYAPAENPTIALTVVLENAGWGGANAGPIARALLDHYLDPADTNSDSIKTASNHE